MDGRYDPRHLTVVKATLDDDEWDALRTEFRLFYELILGPDCFTAPVPQVFEWHPGDVEIDGERLDDVGFRKKGFIGSMSWTTPSLKVDSDRFVDGQEFQDGTEHFTFNNNLQDPGRINTCMAYHVFRKAGVPAPRCAFASLEVNGKDFGVYTNVQPIKKAFLRQEFGNDDGDLYEGAVSDFTDAFLQTFDIKSDDSTLAPLEALRDALEQDDDGLMSALEEVLDVDGYITEWAVESLIGHWDGYAQGTNNFYIYRSSDDGLLHVIPWGTDAVMAEGETLFTQGVLAQRLWNHPEGQQRYLAETQRLLDEVWREDELLAEIDRMEALVLPHASDPLEVSLYVGAMRDFVQGRRASVKKVLDAPPSRPVYESERICFDPVGSVSATFDTEWGTLNALDPFAFPGTLEGELFDEAFATENQGAIAGLDGGESVLVVLGVDGQLDEMTQVAILLPPDVEPGTYPVDIAAVPGYVITGSLLDPFSWTLSAFMGGELVLESVDTSPGGSIRGSLDAVLIPNIFE